MRYLLLSVLVVCVIGVMIPSAFGETWTMTISAGAGDVSCADNDSCVTPSTLTINVGDKVEFISLSKTPIEFRSVDSNNNVDDEFGLGLRYNYVIEKTFTKAGTINAMDILHPWVKFTINVEQKTSSSGAPIHTAEFSKPTIFSETESTINFGIDLPNYFYDEFLSITGTINYFIADENVSIKITNPSGNIVYQKEKEVVNNSFKDLVHLGGNSWNQNGVYTITISYGNETEAILTFEFAKESTSITKKQGMNIKTVTQGDITIKTELVNIERVTLRDGQVINQKNHLLFSVLPIENIRAPSEITLEIPRKFLDSKDQFGNDIPFDVSYIANSEGNTIVRSVIPTEESNDSIRKITIPFNYFPGQRIVTIHGTHFEGFSYSLENVPELKNTIGFDSGWWIGNPNLQLDSEGNIIVRHGKDGGSFQKYNADGKLLLSSKADQNLASWFLDSNDNLYATGNLVSTEDHHVIFKFSNDFKLIKQVSLKDLDKNIRIYGSGIDYKDNFYVNNNNGNTCYKISPNLEILDVTNQTCSEIITKNIRDSNGNYYLRTTDNTPRDQNNICKFSSNGNLITQFSAYGSFSDRNHDLCPNSVSLGLSNNDIFVDSFDNVYVDFGKIDGIQKFSPDLQLLMVWNAESMFGKPKHGGTDRFGLTGSLKAIDESGQFYHALTHGDRVQIYAQPIIVAEPEPIAEPVAKSEPVSEPVAKSEPVSEPAPTQSSGGCGAGTVMVNGVCQLAPTQTKTSFMSIEPIYLIIGAVAIGGAIAGVIAVAKRGSKTPKPAKQELDEYEEQYLEKEKPKRKPVEKKETSSSCSNCGNTLKPTAKFCGGCGTKV